MSPERRAPGGVRALRGIGTIAAIVVLVILSALAAAIAVLSSGQHAGAALDLQGAKALQAARAGLEYGIYRAVVENPANCGTTNLALTGSGFTVTVECSPVNADEQGLGALYSIRSTACQPPSAGACPGDVTSANYLERHLVAVVERAP